MKILISDAFDPALPAKLEGFGEVIEDKERLAEVDVVLVRSKTKCTRDYIDQAQVVFSFFEVPDSQHELCWKRILLAKNLLVELGNMVEQASVIPIVDHRNRHIRIKAKDLFLHGLRYCEDMVGRFKRLPKSRLESRPLQDPIVRVNPANVMNCKHSACIGDLE